MRKLFTIIAVVVGSAAAICSFVLATESVMKLGFIPTVVMFVIDGLIITGGAIYVFAPRRVATK